MRTLTITGLIVFLTFNSFTQSLPSSILMKDIIGGTFTMGSNSLIGSPAQQASAPEHQVTMSNYAMSETEISNAQYVAFLNSAYTDGLIQINIATAGPDNGKRLIQGTNISSYSGKTLYNLDGTRVMKDHDNGDADNNPFTGSIEPENPLNIAYIGFNSLSNIFYVKNPYDTSDFHWANLCNYYDYGVTQGTWDNVLKNDFVDWSGSGQNLSNELQGWTETNPGAATNLPAQSVVMDWPVTFIRWWGAKAFAEYYNKSLPTEAQWEYAAKGGQNFTYAVHDGSDVSDANWNQSSLLVAVHHVRDVSSGTANPYGLYNLAGNVWEWMEDHYVAPYDTVPVTDPLIQAPGSTIRSWRGGSWNYHEATLQSAMRFSDEEDRGNDHFGFRIAGEYSITGQNEIRDKSGFLISPNPASQYVQVDLPHIQSTMMQIYSMQGRLVKKVMINKGSKINIEELEKGVYLILINDKHTKLIVD